MHVAAFIGKLQHFENLKPLYLGTCKWAISPFLSDRVTYAYKCLHWDTLYVFIVWMLLVLKVITIRFVAIVYMPFKK